MNTAKMHKQQAKKESTYSAECFSGAVFRI